MKTTYLILALVAFGCTEYAPEPVNESTITLEFYCDSCRYSTDNIILVNETLRKEIVTNSYSRVAFRLITFKGIAESKVFLNGFLVSNERVVYDSLDESNNVIFYLDYLK